MSTVAIIQPSFVPWRGFFSIIASCDHFVHYDDVQFDKRGWRNRNQIKTATGTQWLTVPVLTKGRYDQRINETSILYEENWSRKMLKAIEQAYSKSAFFDEHFPWLSNVLTERWETIADLDIQLIEDISRIFGLNCKFHRSSKMSSPPDQGRIERLVSLCTELGGSTYISGPSAQDYIGNAPNFRDANIELIFAKYDLSPYKQLYGEFLPHVSILDYLFNCGGDPSGLVVTR